jgi:hypothetical protein
MQKIASISIALSLAVSTFAQSEDLNKLKFGFNVGVNYSNLQLVPVNFINAKGIGISNGVGGRMGILVDYQINERFSFSPKTEMSFNTGSVSLPKTGDEQEVYSILPVTIEVASHFNYRLSARNAGPYISFGPSLKIPLADKKNTMNQISGSPDLALDLGVGLDRMLPSFHFAPELRYSFGLMNLSRINAISKLNFHSISLIFNFKG